MDLKFLPVTWCRTSLGTYVSSVCLEYACYLSWQPCLTLTSRFLMLIGFHYPCIPLAALHGRLLVLTKVPTLRPSPFSYLPNLLLSHLGHSHIFLLIKQKLLLP